jgi:site-specific recombinase XerD
MKKVKSINLKTNPTSYKTKAFLESKRKDKLTENSIRFYESRLKVYADFCGEKFEEIDRGILRNLFDFYGDSHEISSVRALFTAVGVFYNWYESEVSDYIDYDNPMRRLKAPRTQEIIQKPLDLDDFSKMIQYCNTCKKGTFYRSILYFLLQTGVRAAECLSCDIDDVDLISGEVIIRFGKGRKQRTVFIATQGKKALKAYLKTRTDDDPALWISSYGKRLTYSGLNRILKTVAEGAGIAPPTAHMFRRAFCKNMILSKSNINPYLITILMGWSSYAVLQKYTKLYSDDIHIAYQRVEVDKWG